MLRAAKNTLLLLCFTRPDVGAPARGRSNKHQKLLQRGLTVGAIKRASEATLQGFEHFNSGERSLAERSWKQAIKTSDLAFGAQHRLALIALNEGETAKALKIWSRMQDILRELHIHEQVGYGPLWEFIVGGADNDPYSDVGPNNDPYYQYGTSLADALPCKMFHDAQQLRYLAQLELSDATKRRLSRDDNAQEMWDSLDELADAHEAAAESLVPLVNKSKRYGNEHGFLTLHRDAMMGQLGGIYGRNWLKPEYLDLEPIPEGVPTVRPRSKAEVAEMLAELRTKGVVVIDDVLTPDALRVSREACLRAPVFHEVKPYGYLGAYPTTGLLNTHDVFVRAALELAVVFEPLFTAIEHGGGLDAWQEEDEDAAEAGVVGVETGAPDVSDVVSRNSLMYEQLLEHDDNPDAESEMRALLQGFGQNRIKLFTPDQDEEQAADSSATRGRVGGDAEFTTQETQQQLHKMHSQAETQHSELLSSLRQDNYRQALAQSQKLTTLLKGLLALEKQSKAQGFEASNQVKNRTVGHDLQMIWAYSYDNTGSSQNQGKGIGVHADDALVNLNLWITPDSANLDPDGVDGSEGGGLTVYTEHRAEHGWQQTSEDGINAGIDPRDPEKQDKVTERFNGRINVTVPYRQNRIVLFNSELFHRTSVSHLQALSRYV